MTTKANPVEDEPAKGFVDTFGDVHALGLGTGGFDGGDCLGPWEVKFVGHGACAVRCDLSQGHHGVATPIVELSDAGHADSTETQELVVLMPTRLQDAVLQINAGLAVIRSCDKVHG